MRRVSIAIVQGAGVYPQVYQEAATPIAGRNGPCGTASIMTDDIQELLRGWIQTILDRKGWSRTRLAAEAGVSTTTITRLFDKRFSHVMNAASIAKIARATGIPAPRNFGGVEVAAPGMGEPEAAPYKAGENGRQLSNPAQSIWTCRTNSLVSLGLMPGDRFILDPTITPQTRDVIMVQRYDNSQGTAETLLRIYADGFAVTPLYLLDGSPRLWIDGANVVVMGVVVESWRSRA